MDGKLESFKSSHNLTKINLLIRRNPKTIDWSSQGVEFVAECTGVFKNVNEASMHLTGCNLLHAFKFSLEFVK